MKKYFLPLNLCVLLAAGSAGSFGQTAPTAADIAARQEAEERNKRLNATVEDLKETLVAQQKTIASLREEVRQLRDETARVGNHAVGQDTVRRLAEKIQEVDRKRESDNQLIQDTLVKLQKSLTTPQSPAPKNPKTETPPAASTNSDKAIEYTVQKGDRLDLILKSARDQGVKVTQKQIKDANPSINWDRLRVGQKIFIPLPASGKSPE